MADIGGIPCHGNLQINFQKILKKSVCVWVVQEYPYTDLFKVR